MCDLLACLRKISMGRKPCCDKIGLKRGPWTIEEDHRLMNFILNNGIHCWRIVPKLAGTSLFIHLYMHVLLGFISFRFFSWGV